MKIETLKFLHDILDSIAIIEVHLSGVNTVTEFSQKITVSDAVERRLAIIGEALWKASKLEPKLQVTDQQKIIALRHILVHDYDLIDDATIFRICQRSLPVLKQEVDILVPK